MYTAIIKNDINKLPLLEGNKTNNIKSQYELFFGKKELYNDNEIFVFNSLRNAQKILDNAN